jgi:hypothetical protein
MASPGRTLQDRLNIFYERLLAAPQAGSGHEAFELLCKCLEAVEEEFSAIPKRPSPGLKFDGRMYPPQEDRITRHPDGSITADTKGEIIECGADGSIKLTSKRTGQATFAKPGGGQA